MSLDRYPKPKRPNEEHIFAWDHLIVIFIIGIFFFFPAIAGGFLEGIVLWFKLLASGSVITYALRILMHRKRGLIQNDHLRMIFHSMFWLTFLAFYGRAILSWDRPLLMSLLAGFFALFPIGALGITLYFNFILGEEGPIEGWG